MNAKKPSLRAAINAKCKECLYDPRAGKGSWRQQVEACTSPSCPLYDVRPKSSEKTGNSASKNPVPEGLRRWKESQK